MPFRTYEGLRVFAAASSCGAHVRSLRLREYNNNVIYVSEHVCGIMFGVRSVLYELLYNMELASTK